MSANDQDDAQQTVFWVVGAVVTLLLGAMIAWKLMSAPVVAVAAAPARTEQPELVPSLETGTQSTDIPIPDGANLPVSLGELELGFTAESGLTLRGAVPTERKKERLLSQAQLVFGEGRVVDQLSVNESAKLPNWKGTTLDLMAHLAQLGPFQLALKNDEVTIAAEVPDDAIKSAWIDWLANFFVDYPLAVNAEALTVNSALPPQYSFGVSTLFNLAVNFESGSAQISADAEPALLTVATILREQSQNVRIIGHTDASGDAGANRTLSEARAEAVKNFLMQQGVPAHRLSAYGMGQDQPIADNDTEAGRARNRRIEFAQ